MEKVRTGERWLKVVLCFGCGAFLVSLASFVYSGLFSRFMADDYCTTLYTRFFGFWKGEAQAYQIATGRFMSTFFISLSDYLGPFFYRLLPGLLILFWSVGMGWFFWRLRRFLPFQVPAAAAWLLGMLVVLSTLVGTPSRLQSLYWRDGMFNYGLPMLFFPYLLIILVAQLEQHRSAWSGLLAGLGCAALAFSMGGMSETFIAFEAAFFLAATLGFAVWGRGWLRIRMLILLACSLLGALAALVITWLSPATHGRQAYFPPPPGMVKLVQLSMRYAYIYMRTSTNLMKLVTIMTVGLPALIMFYASPKTLALKGWQWLAALVAAVLVGYALLVAICAPSAYGETSFPEGRVLFIGRFSLALTMLVFGGLFGLAFRQAWSRIHWPERAWSLFSNVALAVVVLLSLYGVLISYQINVTEIPARQAWAAVWDQRDAQLRAAAAHGATSLNVVALDSWETIYELGTDPRHWVNVCAAQYYGLKSIVATPP